jgi:hypothetical protein
MKKQKKNETMLTDVLASLSLSAVVLVIPALESGGPMLALEILLIFVLIWIVLTGLS